MRRAPGRQKHRAIISSGATNWPCVIGINRLATRKREGDSATPAGRIAVLDGHIRAERNSIAPGSRCLQPIAAASGWCDAPDHACYNRLVRLPFPASHEKLLREDRLYDVFFVLDWNFRRRTRYRGSAIFLHLASPGFNPTQGCLAIDRKLMRRLIATGRLPEIIRFVV